MLMKSNKDIKKSSDEIDNKFIEHIVQIRENNNKKPTINLDDGLYDEIPEEYYQYDWQETPKIQKDENNLTQNDFYSMEWKETQYHLYRQLVNISSFLSDIKDVLNNEFKQAK